MFGGRLINPNKLTNKELIELLCFENMTIEELTNLKLKIINEMEYRKESSLRLPNEYKSFCLYDYSEAEPYVMEIKFIIDPENSLYGVDEKMNFYVGKFTVGVHPGLYLFKFTRDTFASMYYTSSGWISKDFKRYSGDYWRVINNNRINKYLSDIDYLNIMDNEDLISTYEKIVDEKIPNIDVLISNAYLYMLEVHDKLPNIVDVVSDNYILKRNRKNN